LARRFDDAMCPIGLTNRQFSLMMSLSHPEPVDISGSVTTRNEPNHIARGLLKIKVDAADRRSRVMTLTPKGRRLLARAVLMVFACRCGALYFGLLTKARLAQKQLILGRQIMPTTHL